MIAKSCEMPTNSIPQSLETSGSTQVTILFRTIENEIQKTPVFKRHTKQAKLTQFTWGSIGTGKLISRKMRVKLINWLERLALQTFNFSMFTLLLSIKILDEYLCLTNEPPSKLQLIGSACLFIASKESQRLMVAGQCYVTASSGCFEEQELYAKQNQIFKTLQCNISFLTLSKVYNFMKTHLVTQKVQNIEINRIQELLLMCVKNQEMVKFRQDQIISMLFTLIQTSDSFPELNTLLNSLKENC